MSADTPPPEVDDQFIHQVYEHMRRAQERSLIHAIESWMGDAKLFASAVMVNTDTLFPKVGPPEPKVARFLSEFTPALTNS